MKTNNTPDNPDTDHLGYLLTAYVFENLSPSGKAEVEAHLEHCVECRAQLERLRATLGLAEEVLNDSGITYTFEERRRQRVLEAAQRSRHSFLHRLDRPAFSFRDWRGAAVAAIAALVALALILPWFITAGGSYKSVAFDENEAVVMVTNLSPARTGPAAAPMGGKRDGDGDGTTNFFSEYSANGRGEIQDAMQKKSESVDAPAKPQGGIDVDGGRQRMYRDAARKEISEAAPGQVPSPVNGPQPESIINTVRLGSLSDQKAAPAEPAPAAEPRAAWQNTGKPAPSKQETPAITALSVSGAVADPNGATSGSGGIDGKTPATADFVTSARSDHQNQTTNYRYAMRTTTVPEITGEPAPIAGAQPDNRFTFGAQTTEGLKEQNQALARLIQQQEQQSQSNKYGLFPTGGGPGATSAPAASAPTPSKDARDSELTGLKLDFNAARDRELQVQSELETVKNGRDLGRTGEAGKKAININSADNLAEGLDDLRKAEGKPASPEILSGGVATGSRVRTEEEKRNLRELDKVKGAVFKQQQAVVLEEKSGGEKGELEKELNALKSEKVTIAAKDETIRNHKELLAKEKAEKEALYDANKAGVDQKEIVANRVLPAQSDGQITLATEGLAIDAVQRQLADSAENGKRLKNLNYFSDAGVTPEPESTTPVTTSKTRDKIIIKQAELAKRIDQLRAPERVAGRFITPVQIPSDPALDAQVEAAKRALPLQEKALEKLQLASDTSTIEGRLEAQADKLKEEIEDLRRVDGLQRGKPEEAVKELQQAMQAQQKPVEELQAEVSKSAQELAELKKKIVRQSKQSALQNQLDAGKEVTVPSEILDKAELGDHFETYNADRPETRPAIRNSTSDDFAATTSDQPVKLGGAVLDKSVAAKYGPNNPNSGLKEADPQGWVSAAPTSTSSGLQGLNEKVLLGDKGDIRSDGIYQSHPGTSGFDRDVDGYIDNDTSKSLENGEAFGRKSGVDEDRRKSTAQESGRENAPAGFSRQFYSKAFGSPTLVQGQQQQLLRLNTLKTALGTSNQTIDGDDERTLRSFNFLREQSNEPRSVTLPEFLKRPAPIPAPVFSDEGLDEDVYIEKYGTRPFVDARRDNLSTFGMDVDTASYTLARGRLNANELPDPATVRVEEFVNYFKQPYAVQGDEAFAVFAEAAPSPFQRSTGFQPANLPSQGPSKAENVNYVELNTTPALQILKLGIKSRDPKPGERKSAQLTFALDTSGSMTKDDRLAMVRGALKTMVEKLNPDDTVTLVTFADQAQVALPRTQARQKQRILDALDALSSSGGTSVEAGLNLAYRLADESFSADAVNRVILCSDGVANIGAQGPESMLKTVKVFADRGIDLATVGFGKGQYNDEMLVKLANNGNGSCHFVDSPDEARRVFTEQLPPNLSALARDAKVQVEFNPSTVAKYRLLGYEKRKIADKDFRNDKIDAGEVQHSTLVTVLYELERVPAARGSLGKVFLRWKDAGHRHLPVIERNFPLDENIQSSTVESAPVNLRFLACVARFAELLRDSKWVRHSSYADVLEQLQALPADFQQRDDWKEVHGLVLKAQNLSVQKWLKALNP